MLLLLVVVYSLSSLFAWGQHYIMAGVTQRTVYGCARTSTEDRAACRCATSIITRAATSLTRVTNDIDNIVQTRCSRA